MANFFSDVLTIRDSLGGISDPGTYSAKGLISNSIMTISTNPSDNDVFMMNDIPSNGVLYSLVQFNDDLGTDSFNSVGMFAGETFIDETGTIINKNDPLSFDAFQSTSNVLNIANLNQHLDNRFTSGGSNSSIALANSQMWELAGLNRDPQVNIRIGITITTNWTVFVPGSIRFMCEYVCK